MFNTESLNKQIKFLQENKPKYIIGVDTHDDDISAYCLTRQWNGSTEIILAKRSKNRDSFLEEVLNLAQYFNADIY